MLIEFAPIIFTSATNIHKFNLLFNLFYVNRRYNFFIDITQINKSIIYEVLNTGDQEIIIEYFNRQMTEDNEINFKITDQSETIDRILNLDEAIAYFNQPLSIVLENSLNDKYFFESIVNNFSRRGKNIRRHLGHRWIDFVNGGGCSNIENVLNEKISGFNSLPKSPQSYLRVFVLIDSDSKYPNDINETRDGLRIFLLENGISHHFLIKREMENYLPDEVFDDIPGNKEYIAAYKRLSAIQKDYLDIQNGFEDRKFEDYPHNIQHLYSSVSFADRAVFRKGELKISNFKSEFPKLFLSPKVTRETLKKRVEHQGDNANELEDILEKINKLL